MNLTQTVLTASDPNVSLRYAKVDGSSPTVAQLIFAFSREYKSEFGVSSSRYHSLFILHSFNMVSTKILSVIASLYTAFSIADYSCPPDGPLLPRPKTLASQPAFKAAGTQFSGILDSVITGKIDAGFPVENTSFSIAIISLADKNDKPAWEYHHRGAKNVNGTKTVDGDTQYLIGSISKVFTDLLLLKSGLNLDDPITKYLPELTSPDSVIRWDDISLRALGSHLGGIQGFCTCCVVPVDKADQSRWIPGNILYDSPV